MERRRRRRRRRRRSDERRVRRDEIETLASRAARREAAR
jgi:hypothetical protein